MPAATPELWWALVVGTLVFLMLGLGIIANLVFSQRRFITAQKEQMTALLKSEEEYRDLFNNVTDVVYIHCLNGKILRINPVFTQFLGYEEKDMVGQSLYEIIDSKDHKRITDYLEEIIENGAASGLLHLSDKDGKDCLFEYRSSIVKKDGTPVAVRGVARNVTEQKHAEQALRESEESFRRLVNFSPAPIAVHQRGRWVYVNDAGVQLIKAAGSEDIIGKSIFSFVATENRKDLKEGIRNYTLKGDEVSVLEGKIKCLDGQIIEVEIVAIPMVYDSKPAGQVVIRDVTESKRLQEELARAQRLETAGRVAGQIAHDFNNLLAPLTAYPTLILEDLKAGRDVSEFITEMEVSALKIAEINQQLLTLGRRGHYSMELVDLKELIRKLPVLQSFPKELVLNLEVAPDLSLIKGGAAQLTRAFINLIINAKEAMQDIGILTIKTENVYLNKPLKGYETIAQGKYVKVDISDTGTGIEQEIFNKIFDPFFTTKSMDRMRGSGLGLSIVHGIVKDHSGYLTFKSTLGQGTTFSLYYPITTEVKSKANSHSNGIRKGDGERILLVDDDPVQRTVSSELLKRLGYKVEIAESGEEAVDYAKRHTQDLLVLDMVMGGIDGVETYRQILEFKSDQKAIILSGYAMSLRVEEGLRLGAGAFVSKPVKPKLLANVIRKELDRN